MANQSAPNSDKLIFNNEDAGTTPVRSGGSESRRTSSQSVARVSVYLVPTQLIGQS